VAKGASGKAALRSLFMAAFEHLLLASMYCRRRLLQVATLMSRVSALEAQNSQLRVAAAKREQVLQQSRKFIEGHLARWSPGSAGGAAGAAAAAAAGGGQPGATSNGVGQANGTRGPPGQQ
jgi:hypothetical protein